VPGAARVEGARPRGTEAAAVARARTGLEATIVTPAWTGAEAAIVTLAWTGAEAAIVTLAWTGAEAAIVTPAWAEAFFAIGLTEALTAGRPEALTVCGAEAFAVTLAVDPTARWAEALVAAGGTVAFARRSARGAECRVAGHRLEWLVAAGLALGQVARRGEGLRW
jgi:hypothetical protein